MRLSASFDEYALRSESENRNKELKCDLRMDWRSYHCFLVNLFRLYLYAAAFHVLPQLRREIAEPPQRDPHCPSRRCGLGQCGPEKISDSDRVVVAA